MNILLINHYAGNPQLGMEFRPYYLAKEWIKQGHKVLIVGATFSHLRKEQPIAGLETYDGIDYLWLKTNRYSGNGLKRLLSMFAFIFRLFYNTKQLLRFAPDAVIASSTYPLDIYPARYISKKAKAKLVFEIHDLWPLSPMELGGMSKYHPFIMIMQCAENYAYKHCDTCVSILPCVHQHVKAHGLDLNKLHLVPNGVAMEDWENPEPLNKETEDVFKKLKENNKFIVGYAGGHALSNALDFLIDAVAPLADSEIVAVLVGNGPLKAQLEARVKREKIENVIFLNSVSKKQIPNLLQHMDVLCVGGIDFPLYRFGVSPNKLFDYMMAAKPIIVSANVANDIVGDAQCGICVKQKDPAFIGNGIKSLQSLFVKERQKMGNNGLNYVTQYHSYSVLSVKYAEAIQTSIV